MPHETVNRNKQNLSLDLRHPKGKDIFLQLCTETDIVVETPGGLEAQKKDIAWIKRRLKK